MMDTDTVSTSRIKTDTDVTEYHRNKISGDLDPSQDIHLKFMPKGTGFSQGHASSISRNTMPHINVYEVGSGGELSETPTASYNDGIILDSVEWDANQYAALLVEFHIEANRLENGGTYALVFDEGLYGNQPNVTLGKKIVFLFETYDGTPVSKSDVSVALEEGTTLSGVLEKYVLSDIQRLTIESDDETAVSAEELSWLGDEIGNQLTELDLSEARVSDASVPETTWDKFPKLEELKLSGDITSLPENAFANNTVLTRIQMPGVAEIGSGAFAGCSSLVSADMPKVGTIGSNAFNGCAALSLDTLPESLVSIGSGAFLGCSLGKDGAFHFQSVQPPKMEAGESGIFEESFFSLTIYVPLGSEEAYRSAGWLGEQKPGTVLPEGYVAVSSVQLSKDELALELGEQESLTAEVLPEEATYKTVSWESSRPEVVSVDGQGAVTAEGLGTAVITVSSTDGNRTDTCTVNVNPVSVTGIRVSPASLAMKPGESRTLRAEVLPSNAGNQNVAWSSSNEKAAKVDRNGRVTAASPGTAVIAAKTEDGGYTASIKVTVSPISVTGLRLNVKSATLTVGKSMALKATVLPSNATNKAVAWSSSNQKAARVSSAGRVTAASPGTVTITAAAKGGSAKTTAVIKVRPKTTTFRLTRPSAGTVRVKYRKIKNVDGYVIYRAKSKNGKYRKVTTRKQKKSRVFVNKRLKKKKTYYYKIRTYKTVKGKKIYSAYSKAVKVKTR